MRRYHLLTLVIFAILVIEGCKRSRPARDPISVASESDFLPDESAELLVTLAPTKKIILGLGVPRGPKGYAFPAGTFAPNAEIDWDYGKTDEDRKLVEAIKKQYEVEKVETEKEQRKQDLDGLCKIVVPFIEKNEPPERTLDNLRKDVRRGGKLPLRKLIMSKTIDVVLEVDLAKPKDVVGYYPTSLGTDEHLFVMRNGKIGVDKLDSLQTLAKHQRLYAIQKVYNQYVADNPEERNYKELKEYLQKNLVATAYEAHVKGEILMLDPVKPKGKQKGAPPPIACYATGDKDKNHLCISSKAGKGFIGVMPAPLPPNYLSK